MSLKNFYEEVGKGIRAPAYLIYADDAFLLKEASTSIKKSVPEDGRDFLFHLVDGDSPLTPERIVDILYTIPLVRGRQIVVIEDFRSYDEKEVKVFSNYLKRPSPDSALIMLNSGELKKSHKDALKGAVFISLDIRDSEIPYWLKETASSKGIALTSGAVDYLIGMVGPDVGLLTAELEKLSMIGKQKIEEEDIIEFVRAMGAYNSFDIARALDSGDASRVFGIYRTMSGSIEPQILLGALNWHYGERKGREKAPLAVFELLSEADVMIKTGRQYQMESLLAGLLGIGRTKKTDRRHDS